MSAVSHQLSAKSKKTRDWLTAESPIRKSPIYGWTRHKTLRLAP